ncbi:MAG: shikimate dehydrogenase [Dehalococcoidales bacterium]|nr:MAG: shikimate dehydrogenase [Dehalococcoidales bacterium]
MTDISGKTKVCALIGDPIEHTMSPAMHNAAFSELGLDYVYVAFGVKPDELAGAINGMKSLGMPGWNVTIPHKVNVIPLLDKLDPLAEKIGAVNTVVNDNGILTGHNTDATGFLQAMLEKGVEPQGKTIAIMGAGGAARAVSFILADRGAFPTILNRIEELDWAENLAAMISKEFDIEVPAMELTKENLGTVLNDAEILVNATSVGMSPNDNVSPAPAELLKADLTVYDVIYNPIQTRLLKDAETAGATTIGGIDRLVWQGIMAFEKWTGQKPPFDLMKNQAMKFL